MTIGTTLAVLGIVVTIIVALIRRRYPGRVTFYLQRCIPLFDGVVRHLNDVDVFYDGTPIAENLVLLRAHLLNSGRKDIAPSMVERPLRIELPDGYKWLDVTVVSKSKDVQASLEVVGGDTIQFNHELFRCGESVCFDALAEFPEDLFDDHSHGRLRDLSEQFGKSVRFNHRISDTAEVRCKPVPGSSSSIKEIVGLVIGTLVAGLFAIGGFAVSTLVDEPAGFLYLMKTTTGETVEAEVKPNRDGQVEILGTDGDKVETIPLAQFIDRVEGVRIVPFPQFRDFLKMSALMGGACILFLALLFRFEVRSRRIWNLLHDPDLEGFSKPPSER